MYVVIRTDNPDAEIGLYDGQIKVVTIKWPAHRQLAETIHLQIKEMLDAHNLQLSSVKGIVVFRGPGSFTGLRIGISVANAYAASFAVPIVGENGDAWISSGLNRFQSHQNDSIVVPEYGSEARTTVQRK